jgi:hypothetical protein
VAAVEVNSVVVVISIYAELRELLSTLCGHVLSHVPAGASYFNGCHRNAYITLMLIFCAD